MRIVHLRTTNFYGGPERQIHYHARRALGSPFELALASFSEQGRAPDLLEIAERDGIATKLYAVTSSYDFSVVGRLRADLRAHEVAILCTHDYRSALLGWWATRRTDTRWIAFSRGFTSEDLKVRCFHALDKSIVRFADHVVAVSKSQATKLERLLVPGHKISVVPNAIAPELFAQIGAADLRARFEWPDDAIVVVAGGRFSREKGQLHLIRAAALALANQPRLRFALFGHGPDLPVVQAEAQALGVQDRVQLAGFEPDILACIRGADILVNPSLSEGMPNIVLEAMALGVPVVATDIGGHPELIEDGRTGRLVPAADPRALAAAIEDLARDRTGARELAVAALDFVHRTCTFDRQFERLTEVYRRVGADRAPQRR